MSSAAPTFQVLSYGSLRIPTAVFEVLPFVAGWLSVNGAVVTVVLLTSLIVMSWIHLGQGAIPAFCCVR